jgi:hypothetical protein
MLRSIRMGLLALFVGGGSGQVGISQAATYAVPTYADHFVVELRVLAPGSVTWWVDVPNFVVVPQGAAGESGWYSQVGVYAWDAAHTLPPLSVGGGIFARIFLPSPFEFVEPVTFQIPDGAASLVFFSMITQDTLASLNRDRTLYLQFEGNLLDPNPIPLPGGLLLFASGLGVIGMLAQIRARQHIPRRQ